MTHSYFRIRSLLRVFAIPCPLLFSCAPGRVYCLASNAKVFRGKALINTFMGISAPDISVGTIAWRPVRFSYSFWAPVFWFVDIYSDNVIDISTSKEIGRLCPCFAVVWTSDFPAIWSVAHDSIWSFLCVDAQWYVCEMEIIFILVVVFWASFFHAPIKNDSIKVMLITWKGTQTFTIACFSPIVCCMRVCGNESEDACQENFFHA